MSTPTNYTLLERVLDHDDQNAWRELEGFYQKFIYYMLNEIGVSSNDIDDVSQQVMIALATNLRQYDRNKGKFRSWLKQIIRNSAYMHYRKVYAHQRKIDAFAEELNHSVDLIRNEFDELIEAEWESFIAKEALNNVRQNYGGSAVAAFELSQSGIKADEIAQNLGIEVSSVYTYNKRVKKSLLTEIRCLVNRYEK